MLMWTVVEAGKTVAAATKKNNHIYTRKVIFIETAKAEAALAGGAFGSGVVGRGIIGLLGISPYAKVGQIVLTVSGLGFAAGASIWVDKSLYQSMGLCK